MPSMRLPRPWAPRRRRRGAVSRRVRRSGRLAPSRASAYAAPRPRPFEAAVTSAALPSSPSSTRATIAWRGHDRPTRAPARRLLAGVLAGVLVLSLALPRGRGDAAPGPLGANPNLEPFRGLGVWVDIYDEEAWADPAAAVTDMEAHGVRTLFLQTSNADRPGSFVFPRRPGRSSTRRTTPGSPWWPGTCRGSATSRPTGAAWPMRSRTAPTGDGFDGFGLDIESEAVPRPGPADRAARAALVRHP